MLSYKQIKAISDASTIRTKELKKQGFTMKQIHGFESMSKTKHFVPNGYFSNGTSRPWREVKILEYRGKYVFFEYLDDKTGEVAPRAAVKTVEAF